MLLFIAICTLFLNGTHIYAMSRPLELYTEQSEWDTKFLDMAKPESILTEKDFKDITDSPFDIFYCLALSEINRSKSIDIHFYDQNIKAQHFESARLLHYAFSQQQKPHILLEDEYIRLFLRLSAYALSKCDIKINKLSDIDNGRFAKGKEHREIFLTVMNKESINQEEDYLFELRKAYKNPTPAATSLTAYKMFNGIDSYPKRPLGAIALLSMIKHLYPQHAESYFRLGEIALGRRKDSNSIFSQNLTIAFTFFEEALHRNPKDARVLNYLGEAYYHGWAPNGKNELTAEYYWTKAREHLDERDSDTIQDVHNKLDMLKKPKKAKSTDPQK